MAIRTKKTSGKNQKITSFSLEHLEKILSGTDDIIFILNDQDNSLLALNSMAEKFLGIRKSLIPVSDFISIFPSMLNQTTHQPTSLKQIISSFRKSKHNKEYLIEHLTSRICYELIMEKVQIDKSVNLIFIKLRDITRRITSKEEALRFVHTIGHELKQPLSLIKAYTYYIQRNLLPEHSKLVQYPAKIDQQVDILTTMLNDIVDTTKISNQKIDLNIETLELVQWINQLLTDLRAAYPARHFVLTAPASIIIQADSTRLRQAMMNLCLNSIKYSAEDSTITIGLKNLENAVEIMIIDEGFGIPSADLNTIFEPYFRSPQSKNANPKGLGLGLSLVREIIRVHGGKISVMSEVGKGSHFKIQLPIK